MVLLFTYLFVAIGFSFLCSIAEAVLLSVTTPHIALLEKNKKPSGRLLRRLKDDVHSPLAAILTLNTIAHTVGAAGVGAQSTVVFGSGYVGITSAILTLLILVFSEIIPKTLGAHYWRRLAPITAYGLKYLILALYPFVKLSKKLTQGLANEPTLKGFSRHEFAAMAELSVDEGQLARRESEMLKNLLRLRETRVKDVMTPRTVVFSLPEDTTVADYFTNYNNARFSRVPIYAGDHEKVTGFVLRSDLLEAHVNTDGTGKVKNYRRELNAVSPSISLSRAFEEFLKRRAHIMLVVDEYGGMEGILTLEDVLETLLGLEIIDEGDKTEDMQKLARRLWKRRARKMNVRVDKQ
ncbi:HlyC/CorC family transporter [Exilibacterium tricleocarpae]|uniref:HlyC/CorC family transporter n=1 Tax=Exilibacterium tricleocarpae TaxID=2591008 RepID=A0A545T3M2_9GAMM|nr:hemolysin family protein [Exilibacterium tricleocarpae]TQV71812.1 HlyC/CorC family transporter [Exilibacterium tricleocarpae]